MSVDAGLNYRNAFADFQHVGSQQILTGERAREPLVTIAIPTFRRPLLLQQAVASALSQDAPVDYEVIVVDNDPDEAAGIQTRQLIASFQSARLHYFRNAENIGMFGNWNRCLELARGQWVTILNDDDWLDPSFLAETMAIIATNPAVDLLAVRFEVRDQRGNARRSLRALAGQLTRMLANGVRWVARWPKLRRLRVIDYYLGNPHAGSLGLLFRRSLGLALGGFRHELYPTADNWFFTRFALTYRSWILNRTLAYYRVQANESVKPEVLKRFVDDGLALRAIIRNAHLAPSYLLALYSRLFANYQSLAMTDYWRPVVTRGGADLSRTAHKNSLRLLLWGVKLCLILAAALRGVVNPDEADR